ncbi:unnamed protein product [Rotaria sp. Silwood2]|nr:unnamed protein product [Rotaria sp. Silwood2]
MDTAYQSPMARINDVNQPCLNHSTPGSQADTSSFPVSATRESFTVMADNAMDMQMITDTGYERPFQFTDGSHQQETIVRVSSSHPLSSNFPDELESLSQSKHDLYGITKCFWCGNNFFLTWFILTVIGGAVLLFLSGIIFYYYYVKLSYEKCPQKSNPKYPSSETVRMEIVMMLKGLSMATFCPSLALYLMGRQKFNVYCGVGNYGSGYLVFSFFVIWLATDFFEFFYHRMGYTIDVLWDVHKFHHQFYNPTPFAVIADEYFDQLVRASPLLLLPAIMPINMDLLFFQVRIYV